MSQLRGNVGAAAVCCLRALADPHAANPSRTHRHIPALKQHDGGQRRGKVHGHHGHRLQVEAGNGARAGGVSDASNGVLLSRPSRGGEMKSPAVGRTRDPPRRIPPSPLHNRTPLRRTMSSVSSWPAMVASCGAEWGALDAATRARRRGADVPQRRAVGRLAARRGRHCGWLSCPGSVESRARASQRVRFAAPRVCVGALVANRQ